MEMRGDVESGPISKVERTLILVESLIWRKRTVRRLCVVWLLFVAYAFNVHGNAYHLATAAVPNATDALAASIQDIMQNATEFFDESPERRYERVRADPLRYQRTVSTLYNFDSRLRNDSPLSKIFQSVRAIMEANEYACLAAIHLGIPKRVMVIDETLYANPSMDLTQTPNLRIRSTEESAFQPGVPHTMERYKEVLVRYQTIQGTWTSRILKGMESVCA